MRIWGFFDSVTESRRIDLERYDSFDPILAGLTLMAQVTGNVWEAGYRKDLHGCRRAGFRLTLPSFLVDAFFNSPNGYRAQYAISPRNGELKNRQVIALLQSRLLAYSSNADLSMVQMSLNGVQAKVWIDEEEEGVQRHLHDVVPEISFARWLNNSESGVGTRAPIGTRLVVYGGWVDNQGRERLDLTKICRSDEIHQHGFT